MLFSVTAFFGATWLFMVQPMVAKLLLPSFGGSATVWSTSSLFFQALLLLGYAYTHVATRRISQRAQPLVHVGVLLVPLLVLPLALPDDAAPADGASPVVWLLRVLLVMIGLPYLVLSTTGPLLQRWYSWSDGPRPHDPYFLFACSNLGSFVGLLAYPFAIEPLLSLDQQRWTWSVGFLVFAALVALCALDTMRCTRAGAPHRTAEAEAEQAADAGEPAPTWRVLTGWVLVAFLPSSLMLAVTAHLSVDIAPIPLLWVVPLAVYLATFVAAFARTGRDTPVTAIRVAVTFVCATAVAAAFSGALPVAVVVALDIGCLAAVGFAAHAHLAAQRPSPAHLTTFYLVISVGGALGGLLNGVVAPLLFNRGWELGLTLAGVPLLLWGTRLVPVRRDRADSSIRWFAAAFLGLGALGGAAIVLVEDQRALQTGALLVALAVLAACGWVFSRYPRVLAGALAALALGFGVLSMVKSVHLERTFYGMYKISESTHPDLGPTRSLVHGTTVHGSQLADHPAEPTTYYSRSGPLGDVMGSARHRSVAVVGLGTGAIAAYGEQGDEMTFYEIDPAVVGIAQNQEWFTYLSDSRATVRTVVGDGRLALASETDGRFDLIVLDAFSSDAIPVHLLTREALAGYARVLAPDGRILVHISNRVFDLEPVLADAAQELGWSAARGDGPGNEFGVSSSWVQFAPDGGTVVPDSAEASWRDLSTERRIAWTDNFSSVLPLLK